MKDTNQSRPKVCEPNKGEAGICLALDYALGEATTESNSYGLGVKVIYDIKTFVKKGLGIMVKGKQSFRLKFCPFCGQDISACFKERDDDE